jgi:hypothetical protein
MAIGVAAQPHHAERGLFGLDDRRLLQERLEGRVGTADAAVRSLRRRIDAAADVVRLTSSGYHGAGA